jgi:uncharacterized membrane protein YesL
MGVFEKTLPFCYQKERTYMGDIFNLDNKFFQAVGKIVDCIGLSILWLVCCIPVVTAGAATTALYYTVNKVIRHGRSYVWTEFWHGFGSNFKQSTIVWLIVLAVELLLGMDSYIMYRYDQAGEKIGKLYIVFLVLMAIGVILVNYIFPYIARFTNTTRAIFRNVIYISVANMPQTVVMFVILLGVALLIYLAPYLIVILPAAYMFVVNFLLENVFRKYMSEEDRLAEEERNTDFSH